MTAHCAVCLGAMISRQHKESTKRVPHEHRCCSKGYPACCTKHDAFRRREATPPASVFPAGAIIVVYVFVSPSLNKPIQPSNRGLSWYIPIKYRCMYPQFPNPIRAMLYTSIYCAAFCISYSAYKTLCQPWLHPVILLILKTDDSWCHHHWLGHNYWYL